MNIYHLQTEQNLIMWRVDKYLDWFVVVDLFSGRCWTLTIAEAIKVLSELAKRTPT